MKIRIIDNLSPEICAMSQALYSRSPKSIDDHLIRIEATGADKFMASYYVGYSHKSIGDCGTTTIYIEGVSMLAAKAFQDWQLYNGQEASTRYMDFGNQEGEWFDFYREHLPKVQAQLTGDEKGIKARSFDIMRLFLPAGTKTNFSWHTNLRQAADHLCLLRYHPLEEVQNLAENIWRELAIKYPASFSHKFYAPTEEYRNNWVSEYTYRHYHRDDGFTSIWYGEELDAASPFFTARPPKTELPWTLEAAGYFKFKFTLDFGSYRDLARHRNGVIRVTQLSTNLGFEQWYLNQLPAETRQAAEKKLSEFKSTNPYEIPMGFKVGLKCTFPLNAAVYVAELRSSKAVHPTLRVIAQKMAEAIKQRHGILLHADMEPDDSVTASGIRAKHDIVEKQNG